MTLCPACKKSDLQAVHQDDQPPMSVCSSCGGAWLRANEYALWLKTQMPGKYDLVKTEDASKRLPPTDSNQAIICPDCGHFLRRYNVVSNINFHLDRCHNCNGVWLDRNEWEVLKAGDLQDEINEIFTQPWQKHIQDEIVAQKFDAMYLERFGENDYEKIKEIRTWLQERPNRNMLMAFLTDRDPYSA